MAVQLDIKVSPDKLRVMLAAQAHDDVKIGEVIDALRALKVAKIDEAAIGDAIAKLVGGGIVCLATGVAPIDEKPAKVDLRVPLPDGQNCLLTRVGQGQTIAFLHSVPSGRDGIDVFGAPVPFHKSTMKFGKNVSVKKNDVTATASGSLHMDGLQMWIEPLLEIDSKDPKIPAKFEGDVVLRSSPPEGTVLSVTGSLMSNGAIESMQLTTGGSVFAKGGIIGLQKGHYVIGGELRCRFVSGANLRVAGNVDVQSEILHSRLDCLGSLKAAQGAINGGVVSANGGIECRTIGSVAGTATIVEAGPGAAARRYIDESQMQIDANKKRCDHVRSKIEPLMKIIKQLTPQQREKVTELLSEADELETTADDMHTALDKYKQTFRANGKLEVAVANLAYPGVTVRLGDLETRITSALKGPFTILSKKIGGATQIALLEPDTQKMIILPHVEYLKAAA